jgi:hypothetical protein
MLDVSLIPILLTSSVIAHDQGVQLQNPQERVRLALESVQRWRTFAPRNPLVLCDGSDFDFAPLLTDIPNSRDIECLSFQNDVHAVVRQGRGHGEGEIVKYAVTHSTNINTMGYFAKCTSKLWVENFSECMEQWHGKMLLKGVFNDVFSLHRPTRFAYIDTRFYVMQVDFYKDHFLNAHELIQASRGHGLEECFRDMFLGLEANNCLMAVPPVICGMGGGTGKYYKNNTMRRTKERLRYRLIQREPDFKAWFA